MIIAAIKWNYFIVFIGNMYFLFNFIFINYVNSNLYYYFSFWNSTFIVIIAINYFITIITINLILEFLFIAINDFF